MGFSNGGDRNLLVQSEVTAESTVGYTLITCEVFSLCCLIKPKKIWFIIFTESFAREDVDLSYKKDTFKSFNKNYIDFIDIIKDSGGDLALYWLSFIEMTEVLPNIIFVTQSGNCYLL